MKSSLPEADRHDENVTQRDDYKACEIPYGRLKTIINI